MEDKKKLAMTQQHITNPELDINICMFSELQPVPNDMIIISNTPATATVTNRILSISNEAIIKSVSPQTTKMMPSETKAITVSALQRETIK